MLIFHDIFSGDELCSDSYPMSLVDDVVYEFTGKHIVRKEGEISLPGANPAEGEVEDYGEAKVESGLDIVLNHQLVEMPFYEDVKVFKEWAKEYLKKFVFYLYYEKRLSKVFTRLKIFRVICKLNTGLSQCAKTVDFGMYLTK
ncbi:unnamed protein product [Soboliphyme baturini]|uniref:Translationally-controlled tumor protein homolog n=1 Tax=Soboliphyme baturini TaxID=241478 RepID=A0A183I9Q9_9BILA|nr:unnamed protein product [Soboliphyme baturini]